MSLGSLLWEVNPKGRRKRRKASSAKRRHRRLSAKQIAAGFGGGKRKARRATVYAVNPSRRRRRSRKASARRRFRRNPAMSLRRGFSLGGSSSGVVSMLKSGAIGGAGGILVDVGMGIAQKFLPPVLGSPMNADGSANYAYFGVKGAIAIGLGLYGKRIPGIGPYAPKMAEGALTVMSYNLMRPLVPSGIVNLGRLAAYFNPAPTMAGRRNATVAGEQRAQNQPRARLGVVRGLRGVRAYQDTGSGRPGAAMAAYISTRR